MARLLALRAELLGRVDEARAEVACQTRFTNARAVVGDFLSTSHFASVSRLASASVRQLVQERGHARVHLLAGAEEVAALQEERLARLVALLRPRGSSNLPATASTAPRSRRSPP